MLIKPTVKFLFLLLVLNWSSVYLVAQDAAIVAFNSNSNDGYAIVALVDIPETQPIYVTDAAYVPSSNSFDGTNSSNESTIRISWTGTWTKGTIMEIEEISPSNLQVTTSTNGPANAAATIVYSGDGFSLSNEGVSVFTASDPMDPDNSIVEIHANIMDQVNAADPDPAADPDCPCSADMVSINFGDGSIDFYEFRPALRGTTVSLADYTNLSNWDTDDQNVDPDKTEFTSITFGGSGILPVVFGEFRATLNRNSVHLDWQTFSEENNAYFEVERSLDGRIFRVLGEVVGQGNSVMTNTYQYVDKAPLDGTSYYRLRQVDIDDVSAYSPAIAVNFSRVNHPTVLYPNPAGRQLSIVLPSVSEEFIFLEIYDLNQQLVLRQSVMTSAIIPIADLVTGTYFVRGVDAQGRLQFQERIVKL